MNTDRRASPRVLLGAIVAGVIAVYLAWGRPQRASDVVSMPGKAVPVVATAIVGRADVPLLLSGIGTVQPYRTVLVRAQMDGEITALRFTDGALVRRGAVLAELDDRAPAADLAAARATQARDRALLDEARVNLGRYETLLKQDSIAVQTVDAARSLAGQYTAAIANDRAQADRARVRLGYARILSPIDGVASLRHVDVGNLVHASDATGLVTINQVQPIAIIVALPSRDLSALQARMAQGSVMVTARDRTSARIADQGVVEAIDNAIDLTTGTFKLKARFANPAKRLWPGQAVDAEIGVGTATGAVVVPSGAVFRGDSGLLVYRVGRDSSIAAAPIVAGETTHGVTIVDQGLSAGDEVIVEGQYKLEPGARVVRSGPPARTGFAG